MDSVLDRAATDAASLAGIAEFQTTWVLVVTWVRMTPLGWTWSRDQVREMKHGLVYVIK